MEDKIKVLFICVHNSARSQIAEEYLRKYGGDLFETESAGLEPGTLNPYVIEALKQDGIDIFGKKTKSVKDLFKEGKRYNYVITVCSRSIEDKCPVFPGALVRLNWPFPDPERFHGESSEIQEQVNELRDIIRQMVEQFVEVKSLQSR
ncbi:arsenate reductase ArsC [Oceanispirochaeta crateris]|uniref:Arsenate reductase ArsC n=1 Tax=Oceanispirochaeta crateris TaxID=2518645 RepID=A0A5C1QPT6_9SPIO|nr:arsenate reductase ArsC [Oceanispirochaeta crateris]QEN08614.1 arsenate reductase ArsC [Oceanispirochaeta crateris]